MTAFPTLIGWEEAAARVAAHPVQTRVESVRLEDALGRVLARDIESPLDVPPFDRSAMDGFAVRSADIAGASRANPARLRVVGERMAGAYPSGCVRPGTAWRIATGAPVPTGCDVVVPIEAVVENAPGEVQILSSHNVRTNISPSGEEISRGQGALGAGGVLSPEAIGVLAALGQHTVAVYARPRVALLTTGDEVQDVGGPLERGKVYNSGFYASAARLRQLGAAVSGTARSIPDEVDAITAALEAARSTEPDVILTTGGVSVGDRDLVLAALEAVGASPLFWRVRMRPGKAFVAADWDGRLIFGLSGNPAAGLTSFELFVRPHILRLCGHRTIQRPEVEAILVTDFDKRSPRPRFLRGRLSYAEGEWQVYLSANQKSGVLSSWLASNCFVCIPEGSDRLRAGNRVKVMMLTDPFKELDYH